VVMITREFVGRRNAFQRLIQEVIVAGAVEIRDIERGEKPFLYSSGNWGPGYISIKGLGGRAKATLKALTLWLAAEIAERTESIDFVAGNVSGGMIPGWELSEYLEILLRKEIPFVYIRDTRKKGGQRELVTGLPSPKILSGSRGIDVEELVNFAETTCHGVSALRAAGCRVNHAACILFYENPEAIKALREADVEMVSLFTLTEMLDVLERSHMYEKRLLDEWREWREDPFQWQTQRGLTPVAEGGTK